jgi:CRISPR system Cascade subunit CasA
MINYNLVTDDWIPVKNNKHISLEKLFNQDEEEIITDPISKICILKFLLAIAQYVSTPDDDDDWFNLTKKELQEKCIAHLHEYQNKFYIYGDDPFLQFTALKNREIEQYDKFIPYVASGDSSTVFNSRSLMVNPDEIDIKKRILILFQLSAFALSGKGSKSKDIKLTGEKQGRKVADAGFCMGSHGFMHNFIIRKSIMETIICNLLTKEDIHKSNVFKGGVGIPPWVRMPENETDCVAESLKISLMGTLIPLSRFFLLNEKGVSCINGIAHLSASNGRIDPSVPVDVKNQKAMIVRTNRKPWRSVTSILSFLDVSDKTGWVTLNLKANFTRSLKRYKNINLWSGGISCSSVTKKAFFALKDDYLYSEIEIDDDYLESNSFLRLKSEMSRIEKSQKILSDAIKYYNFNLGNNDSKKIVNKAIESYWEMMNKFSTNIIKMASDDNERATMTAIRKSIVNNIFNQFCPTVTPRQIESYVKSKKYLSKQVKSLELEGLL